MRRSDPAIIGIIFLVCLESPAFGCSVAMCLGGGIEVNPQAAIRVFHRGSPLSGASVTISESGQEKAVLKGATDANGSFVISRLTPGEYWLNVEFLGISAALHCFHVGSRPSWRAKRKLKYEWGDWPTPTRYIAGELIDSQPGTGGGALVNQVNRIDVPIAGAEVTLHDPQTGEVMRAHSAEDGSFAFSHVREAVYVLRIAGGNTGRSYYPASIVVQRTAHAPRQHLRLQRVEGCGEPSLRPVWR